MDDLTKLVRETRGILDRMERRITGVDQGCITIPADVWEGFQRAVNGTQAPIERRSGVERRECGVTTFMWDIPTGEDARSCRTAKLFFDMLGIAHTCRRVAEADRRRS